MSAAPATVGSAAPAAVEASTAMGSTAPMEAAASAAVEAFTTMEATAAMSESAATGVPVATAGVPVAAPRVAAVVVATPVSTAAIVAVVPRAGADKDAADEVIGTVKAIRCASVGVVAIVSIRANRSRADSDANGNLSMGVACGKHENAK
jgi:hypothetical protein